MNFRIGMRTLALAAVFLASSAGVVTAADYASLLAQGNKQWTDGKLEDAKKSFEQAVATNPLAVDGQMKLAGLLLASGKYDAAVKTYQKAISLDGKNARAWMGLGVAYRHAGDKELSQAAFEEAVRIEPARKAQLAKVMEKPAEQAGSASSH